MTHVLKENLEDTTGLLVDEAGDTLDTATTRETTNGGLRDTLNVVAKNLAVTLSTTLSETLGRGSQHLSRCSVITSLPCHPFHGRTCFSRLLGRRRREVRVRWLVGLSWLLVVQWREGRREWRKGRTPGAVLKDETRGRHVRLFHQTLFC